MTWPVSDAFKAALRKSHTPTLMVEIFEGTTRVAATDVLTIGEHIDVLTGSTIDDRKAAVGRRTASLTILDKRSAFLPITPTRPTHPLRDRDVRLWRGIAGVSAAVGPGDPSMVPLATVQLETSRIADDGAGITWELSGTDRSMHLSNSDWRSELVIANGTTPRAATLAILAHVDAGRTYVVADSPTTKTLNELVFLPGEDPDPWQAIVKIWESAAQEVEVYRMGEIRTRPIPDPLTAPIAWEYLDDSQSIRVAPLNVDVDRSTLRNGVRVRSSAPWLLYGVVAEAWDTDPHSDTYYDPANPAASKVGPHPEEIDDSLIGSEAEAQALATAKLPDVLGIEEQVTYSSVPNPARDSGDVELLANRVTGTSSRFVLDRVETPLTYEGTQTANTRRRTH